ncbi:MAG: sulfatase [Zavarzinella sp.]
MRFFSPFRLHLIVLAACWCVTDSNAQPANLPKVGQFADCNVIFVSFDALQARHCQFLGYPRKTTPHLDKLAQKSYVFENVYSVASWTVPASMTWFTGVYPSEHRMTNKFALWTPQQQKMAKLGELAPELVTLADLFRAAGYKTGGFTGNAGVSGGFGYEQGFDRYYFPANVFGKFENSIPRALEWIKEHRDKRFFLFLHGYDVHGQCMPTGGYDYRFVAKGYDEKFTGSALEQEILREEGLSLGKLAMRQTDVDFWRAIYDEKIQRTDEQFGKFMEEFQKLKLNEKTIIIITSDHGTEFHEHGRYDHGFTLYNELLHVPMLIHLPKQSKSHRIATAISSIDLMPTILDLVGQKSPQRVAKQLRGKSLRGTMEGISLPSPIFSETDYREYTYKRATIDWDGWKLILTMENNTKELYHLPTDPKELTNLVGKEPKITANLEAEIYRFYENLGHDLKKRTWKVGLNPVYPSQGKQK